MEAGWLTVSQAVRKFAKMKKIAWRQLGIRILRVVIRIQIVGYSNVVSWGSGELMKKASQLTHVSLFKLAKLNLLTYMRVFPLVVVTM